MSVIKLDIDSIEQMDKLEHNIEVVGTIIKLHPESVCVVPSSTEGHYHVTVKVVEELKPMELCCVQAILGSDSIREAFNFRRIRRGQKNWNILFQK